MNSSQAITLACLVAELTAGGIAAAFTLAPGLKHVRVFGLFALVASTYTVCDLIYPWPEASDALVLWAARCSTIFGAATGAAWLSYTRVRRGLPALAGFDQALVIATGAVAALCLVPQAPFFGPTVTVDPGLGVIYRNPEAGPLAVLSFVLLVGNIFASCRHVLRASRRSFAHVLAVVLLVCLGVNDALVAAGVLASFFLVSVSFVAMVAAMAVDAVSDISARTRALSEMKDSLAAEVVRRSHALVEAQRELDHAHRLASLGRIAASVGHEINNPLTYVIGNLEVVREQLGAAGSGVLEPLADALAGADRIARIVKDLRVLVQKEHSDQVEAEVDAAVTEALRAVPPQLLAGVEISRDVEPGLRVAMTGLQLGQVLTNLVINAVQAMAGQTGPKKLTVVGRRLGERAHLMVSDTGPGIPEEQRALVFEPFYSTKGVSGTGLGLALCDSMVRSAGGALTLTSAPGQGTTFTAELATVVGPNAPVVAAPSPVPEVGPSARVLVVDDDEAVGRSIVRLLRGHQVELIADPRVALERLREAGCHYDLIVCDVTMTPIDGLQLRAAVAITQPAVANRFVFITGGAVSADARSQLASSAVKWLEKPIDSAALRKLAAESAGPRAPSSSSERTPPR